jgi:hypothetical protein
MGEQEYTVFCMHFFVGVIKELSTLLPQMLYWRLHFRCEEKRGGLTPKLLPKKPARILRNTLIQLNQKNYRVKKSSDHNSAHDVSIDRDFQQKRKEVIFLWLLL